MCLNLSFVCRCKVYDVGVIQFVFIFSNFYWLDLHNEDVMCCISKSTMSKTWIENQMSLVIGSACFADYLTAYVGAPNRSHYWVSNN